MAEEVATMDEENVSNSHQNVKSGLEERKV